MQEWIGKREEEDSRIRDPEEAMSGQSRPYAIHSDSECDRLERQAMLAGLEQHRTVLTELPRLTSILDVGCGSGSMARLLATKYPDARVVGADLRSDYVAYARDRARGERQDNLRFEQGDIFHLPFGDGAFDLVWSKYVLQWLQEPAPAVAELRRVTCPGGSVICSSFDGFAITHWPEDPTLQADAERVFSGFVDPYIGLKMASLFAQAGLTDLAVHFEPDRLSTIVGQIDAERRRGTVPSLD
jgi:ubiquinone/menaquinone biosynthesis C-methylase UbiE